jgi:hypothetical protein
MSNPSDRPKVSLQDFYDMLNTHDWFYEFSDDNRVWNEGIRAEAKLLLIASTSDKHTELFKKFNKWCNESIKGNKTDKPVKPS